MIPIFISSVQKEFSAERRAVRDFIHGDPLLRRFFDVFLFEDLPASDRRADEVYLDQAVRCPVYVGFFGDDYGSQAAGGLSPTEREFNAATTAGRTRLIFVKGQTDASRSPEMLALIRKAGEQLIRRRFTGIADLNAALYASLVEYLEEHRHLTTRPFDAAACPDATLDDLSEEKLQRFLSLARIERQYPLRENTPLRDALIHLNLLDGECPTHAAVLLFGKRPQSLRTLLTSEVKCMHFHGLEVRKPIPSYHIYKGTAFELVDQAVDFVMSKIDCAVGTRALGPQAPVTYELPREAVAEAIVNAVTHRDYTSNASAQVMLFSDRLEVWNPGELPPPLTIERLRFAHASIPRNPLIADPMFLARYAEKAGSGILDMMALCRDAGLPEPQFRHDGGQFVQTIRRADADQQKHLATQGGIKSALSQHQVAILHMCLTESSLLDMMKVAGRSDRTKFRHQVVNPLLADGLIERTIPGKPNSRLQKYRLTEKGRKAHKGIQP